SAGARSRGRRGHVAMANAADDLDADVEPEPGTWPPVPRDRSVTVAPDEVAPLAAEPAPARSRSLRSPRAPKPTAAPARAPLPSNERRYRQTVAKVDLWSVLKMSVCFYICAMAVLMIALVVLWSIADAAGVVHSVEKFFGDLLQTKDFTFLDG